MSLYVSFENQSLLWNIIHKNTFAQQFFEKTPNLNKDEWFKSIIQHFYSQNQSRQLTINELQKINQDTLLFMLESMRTQLSHVVTQQPNTNITNITNTSHSNNNHSNNNHSHSNINELTTPPKSMITSQLEHDYSNRQKEYERMTEKKVPENVNFKDAVDDQPLSNIQELVNQQIKQREDEMRTYARLNATNINNDNVTNVNSNNTNENVKLSIDNTQSKTKKTVTWSNAADVFVESEILPTNEIMPKESNSMFYEEFLLLKQQVLDLSNKISTLEKEKSLTKVDSLE